MATFIVAAVLAVALFFALRHIYRNFHEGKSDCCGASECSGSCCGCHSVPEKK
ncbi:MULTISPECIES: FeoB-associated Cys-rich membrane protein [Selenomonas]|uniref:FeoB-associated Cys-rich membrane protein n=1 Tax=Selenomonas ruminis TaxID=2593411 RepID=A0A5D6W3H8_9FIRM|nr:MULTISPECIES: FeoB-associated Cys-rich membrane protein [unclassified Selenomonas]MBQ1867689.1 FeoB-associated Cys-rich membrane protein [Selenomonas sp.]TYZ21405.1 FeoB-associated Cys-rich membrane protein [Selenomonas sp. mPRGC5]